MKKILLSFLLVAFIFPILFPGLSAQISVTATEGTLNGSYTTLKAAFDAINSGTHRGSVSILVTDNTSETATAALNASGSGSSSYTGINISPDGGSARVISGSLATALISLNGADNVTVNGLNSAGNSLTFENTSISTSATVLIITNTATGNTITNCSFNGSTAANTTYGVVTFYNGTNTANTISYCNLGPAGSNSPWACIVSSGGTNNSNTVDHCNMFDYFAASAYQAGIYLKTGNSSGWTITNNSFFQTGSVSATAGTVNGIYIGSGNGYSISGNYFGGSSAYCGGTAMTYTGTLYSMSFIETAKSNLGLSNSVINNIHNNTISNIHVTSANTTSMGYLWESRFSAFKLQGGKHSIKNNVIGSSTAANSIVLDNGSYASPYSIILLNGVPSAWSSTGLIIQTIANNTVGGITINSSSTNFFSFIKAEINNTGDILQIDSICDNTFGSATTGNITIPNSIAGGYHYGIYIQSGSNTTPTVFSGNTLQEITLGAGPMTVVFSMQMMHITDNIIRNISTNGNAIKGIYYTYSSTGSTISGNHINNLISTATSSIYGITVDNSVTNTIFNNIITLGVNSSRNNAYYGINVYYGSEVYFNTVYIGGTGTSGSSSSYAFYNSTNGYTRNIRSNIFANYRTNAGGTGTHYGIYLPGTISLTINYNNYYTPNTGGMLGFLAGNRSTLAQWQSSTGQDPNSLSTDPVFNESGGNLATDYIPAGEMSGTSISVVTTDFGGVERGSTPTMGSYEPGKVWTGSVSADWNIDGNWSPSGVPTEGVSVTVAVTSNNPVLDQDRVVGNLSISGGASLTVPVNKGLTVNGELVNNGDAGSLTLLSNSSGSGSLITSTTGVSGRVQRYIPGNEWHLISSPIEDGVSGQFTGRYLQTHDEPTNQYADITANNISLCPGKGYAVFSATGFTTSFEGKLNAGVFGSANNISHTGQGWNLVGNPYPSSINLDAVSGWTKINVRSATYVHVDAATWASYVSGVGTNGGSSYIAPGQGFFVQANNAGPGTLMMDDNVRIHSNTSFFKNTSVVPDMIRLKISGNGYADETVVRIKAGSSNDYDAELDAIKLFGTLDEAPQIYSLANDEKLSINAIPQVQDVPFGITAGLSGTYTVEATEVNNMREVILEDIKTGSMHDLKTAAYSFDYDNGEDQLRFILHFTPLGLQEPVDSGAAIYASEQCIIVHMPQNDSYTVNVYDIAGKLIHSKGKLNGTGRIRVNETGVYLVNVISGNTMLVKKVLIQG